MNVNKDENTLKVFKLATEVNEAKTMLERMIQNHNMNKVELKYQKVSNDAQYF